MKISMNFKQTLILLTINIINQYISVYFNEHPCKHNDFIFYLDLKLHQYHDCIIVDNVHSISQYVCLVEYIQHFIDDAVNLYITMFMNIQKLMFSFKIFH